MKGKLTFLFLSITLFLCSCTLTPPAEIYVKVPGIYEVNSFYTVTLQIDGSTTTVKFNIDSIEILSSLDMQFNITWSATGIPTGHYIYKSSDYGNINMYLVDDMRNRYNFFDLGGAALGFYLSNEEELTGYFLFPPAADGATQLYFHDDDQNKVMGNMSLMY